MSTRPPLLSINLVCDALSAAYLGCYGNEWISTPALDRFAHEGITFDHVFSPLDVIPGGWRGASFDESVSRWREAGIKVVWFSDRAEATPPDDAESPALSDDGEHSLDRLLGSAFDWIEANPDQPAIIWIEIGLAPASWEPSAESLAAKLEGKDPVDPTGRLDGMVEENISVDDLDPLRDTYAARVEEFDRSLGEFLESLRELGVYDSALITLTADQGWPLGEHDAVGFARPWVNEERDHVPLLMRIPGGSSASRSPGLITTTDLAPTIDEFFGMTPDESLGGKSLAPLIRGEPVLIREYLISGLAEEEFAIRTQGWKLILPCGEAILQRPRQLYSKPEDRWEVNDMADQKHDIADHLELQLHRYLDALARDTIDTVPLPPLRKDILSPTE